MYCVYKMFLMMEKQKNRGQDGAGYASIKFDLKPGQKYFYRVRSFEDQAIHSIFKKINKKVNSFIKSEKITKGSDSFYQQTPFLGQVMLGHVRYGTYGKNSIDYVQPMMRQNKWMNRNLILAGNFNMTNTDELFQSLVKLGQHPREQSDTITIMERIGHFLDSEVISGYNKLKKKGILKSEMPPLIEKELNIEKILKKSSKKWDGGYVIAGMIGHGDSFVIRDTHGIRPAYYFENKHEARHDDPKNFVCSNINKSFKKMNNKDFHEAKCGMKTINEARNAVDDDDEEDEDGFSLF